MKANVARYMFSRQCNKIQQDDNKQVWLFNEDGKCTKLGFAASQLVPLLINGASYDELLTDAAKRAECRKPEIKAMLSGLLQRLIDEEYIEQTFKTEPIKKVKLEYVRNNPISETLVKISVFTWVVASTTANVLLLAGVNILHQPLFEPFSLTITFALLALWICCHEYSHYLAAIYVGYKNVTFGIVKRKLFYTVATQIPPQIGISDPGKRSVVSSAGMICDGFFLGALVLVTLFNIDANWTNFFNAVLVLGALSLCLNASIMKGSDGSNVVYHLSNLFAQKGNKSLRWPLNAARILLLVNTLLLLFYLLLLIIKSDAILIQVQEHWSL